VDGEDDDLVPGARPATSTTLSSGGVSSVTAPVSRSIRLSVLRSKDESITTAYVGSTYTGRLGDPWNEAGIISVAPVARSMRYR
jgi:hypothetical protein